MAFFSLIIITWMVTLSAETKQIVKNIKIDRVQIKSASEILLSSGVNAYIMSSNDMYRDLLLNL